MELSRTSLDVGEKGKIDERTLQRLMRMVEKTPHLTSKDLKANLEQFKGHGFNKYYTLH